MVWPNLFRSILILGFIATWFSLGQNAVIQQQELEQTGNPWVGLGALLVMGLLLIFYFRNKAVVTLAIKQLRVKSQVDKKKISSDAEPYIGSLIKFGFVSVLLSGILFTFLSSPVFYLNDNGFVMRAGILAILAILVFLPVFGLIYCSMVFGPMFMVIHYLAPWDSARASTDVFRGNWLFLSGLWLILFGIELVGLALSVGLMLLAMLPFVLLMQIFYDVGGSTGATALQALAGIAGFVVFFMSQAWIAAYQRVAWAITFFEIVRPVKTLQAEEPETIPEVIS